MLNQRNQNILKLSLPLIGGMISQNILNIVDTAMVGQLGTQSLASVGLGSFLNFLCAALVMGLSAGVQTQCARLRGSQDELYAVPLNGGLTLSLMLSLPLTIIFIILTPQMMNLVTDTEAITLEGGSYLAARLLGLMAIGINFTFRSYWSAVERTSIYLVVLVIMHFMNILGNWIFIFGHLGAPSLGVEGAGLSSAISVWIGAILYLGFALKYEISNGFLKQFPKKEEWKELLRMSIPSGIERLLFALGMTVFMTFIGWVGEEELAASNIMINLFLVAILPGMGFGIASATFVAKSIGAQRPQDIQGWRRDVSWWSLGALSLTSMFFYLFRFELIGQFTTDPIPTQLALDVLNLLVVFLPAEAFHMVFYQSLLGLGDNRMVMMINLSLQWVISLPLVYLFGVSWGWGLLWIWGIHLSVRILSLICYFVRWELMVRRLCRLAHPIEEVM